MRSMAYRSYRSAFTLIELLMVLVILAVLAAVVVPRFAGRSEQARLTAAKTQVSLFRTALSGFEVDMGRYPSEDEGLAALVERPTSGTADKWAGPYLEGGIPSDPWGHPYVYRYPGQHNTSGFDLFSMGPDGREGGNDDVDNWSPN